MGSLYRSRHELIFVFRNGKAAASQQRPARPLRAQSHQRLELRRRQQLSAQGPKRALELHPTVKPIALVADALLDVTKQNDIVIDPFCGSGATILAAERTGRRGYGVEIDPLYVDTTIARWEKMTGRQARHASGKTFVEFKAGRAEGGVEASASEDVSRSEE